MIHLASTSPRRRALLSSLGEELVCSDPGLDDATEEALAREALARGARPAEAARRLAVAKLLAALPTIDPRAEAVAADTVIEFDGALIGKARDRAHAAEILRSLRGGTHELHTGLAYLPRGGSLRVASETSRVRLRAFSEEVLAAYLDTGRWEGKAGAYGVQDPEAVPLVAGVEGSESNVRGLPLELLARLREEGRAA